MIALLKRTCGSLNVALSGLASFVVAIGFLTVEASALVF